MLAKFISLDIPIILITEEMYFRLIAQCRDYGYSEETVWNINACLRKLINVAYPNETMSEKMTATLHRTKPYRHFKDLINSLGIAESYYDFRHKVYLEKAKEWCEYHCLKYED